MIVEADANDVRAGVAADRGDGRNRRGRRRRAGEQIFELCAPAAPKRRLDTGAQGPGPKSRRAGEITDRGHTAVPRAFTVNRAAGGVEQNTVEGVADTHAQRAEPWRLGGGADGGAGGR